MNIAPEFGVARTHFHIERYGNKNWIVPKDGSGDLRVDYRVD